MSKFLPGDRVECVSTNYSGDNGPLLEVGKIYTVDKVQETTMWVYGVPCVVDQISLVECNTNGNGYKVTSWFMVDDFVSNDSADLYDAYDRAMAIL